LTSCQVERDVAKLETAVCKDVQVLLLISESRTFGTFDGRLHEIGRLNDDDVKQHLIVDSSVTACVVRIALA